MDGNEIVKIIEGELLLKDISKQEFYEACDMNSATLSNWRNNKFAPSQSKLNTIEKYLGIRFDDYKRSGQEEETRELQELLRNRQDLRILLKSARGVPPSSIYALISQIEREKENVASD